ncbi:MAG: ABC transporter ATP-binding protein, partial [Gemmatimonadaceae bacterium]|nr:ABC transporter ATP-binding protein [Acetobacteraceae bacterium]
MDALLPAALSQSDGTRALLGRLWREHMRHHRGRLIAIMALTAVMAALTALYPVVIDRAFSMFTSKDERILYQIPALVVAVTALKAAAQYGQNVLTQQTVLLVIRELQGRMFAHLAMADLAQVEREAPAQLAARFTTDAAIIREALTRAVNGVKDTVTVLGLVASMLYLDWVLSAIAAALYPLALLPIQRLGKRIRRASGGMQERMGETAALLHESFVQARTVRAYRLEAIESARADRAFADLYRALLRMTRSRARLDPMLEILGGTAVAAVIGFAGWRAAQGDGGIGNFTGFVAALLIAAQPLRALGSMNAAVQEGLAGLSRVFGVIDEPPAITEPVGASALPPGRGRVRFDDVRFAYPDGRLGLSGLSFEASPGLTVALVGPSGAGKSTALALIPRLQDVLSGAITIDGADVRDVTLASLRDAIAYVGQDTLLFDDTVAANIRMGRPGAGDAEVEAAAHAAAAGFVAGLPQGFAT